MNPSGAIARALSGGEDGTHAGLVEVDATDAGGPEARGRREFLEEVVRYEPDVDAVEHGGEPLDHGPETSHDVGEALEYPAHTERSGVVHHRFEAQYVLAFGITLERQEPEVDLEQRQVITRCLDHDCLAG